MLWLVLATGTFVGSLLGVWIRNKPFSVLLVLRYAIYNYFPLFLLDSLLKGFKGIGWAAGWFPF